jgi:hypothetical protein
VRTAARRGEEPAALLMMDAKMPAQGRQEPSPSAAEVRRGSRRVWAQWRGWLCRPLGRLPPLCRAGIRFACPPHLCSAIPYAESVAESLYGNTTPLTRRPSSALPSTPPSRPPLPLLRDPLRTPLCSPKRGSTGADSLIPVQEGRDGVKFLRGLGMACEFKVQGSGSYLPRLSTICLIHLICGERKNTTGSATLWRCTNWSTASGGRR